MAALLQSSAGARPFAWRDVRVEAEAELARARAEAERLLTEARAEGDRIRTAAREEVAGARTMAEVEGREAGRAAGNAEVLSQVQARMEADLPAIRAAFQAVSEALQGVPAQASARAETEAVRLALEIAALVVRREVKLDPALVAGSLRAAVEALAVPGKVTARVNPEDKVLLEPRLGEILRGLPVLDQVELVADPSVSRGGCMATASGASADASVETQLAEIRKTLFGEGA